MSFFSYCPLKFKINAISTLLHRAYHICSSFSIIHSEFDFIKKYFIANGYPVKLIDSQIKKFLNKIYSKGNAECIVRKQKMYITLPFFGPISEDMKKELYKCLTKFYSTLEFNIILTNPLKLYNFFPRKERLPLPLRSSIIYQYNCPNCKIGSYIGSTSRCFQVRVDEHRGISTRTNLPLAKPSYSSIRNHCNSIHGTNPLTKDFMIIDNCQNNTDLLILESIYISKIKPSLNETTSAYPLSLI